MLGSFSLALSMALQMAFVRKFQKKLATRQRFRFKRFYASQFRFALTTK